MADTHDWTAKANTSGGTTQKKLDNDTVTYSIYIDASTYNMVASDVYQIFKVESGFTPMHFFVHVATAEGSAATLDIGDGSSTTRFETDANLNSLGDTVTLDVAECYTAADTIDIIPSAAIDAAKFSVTMVGCYTKLS
jgi:hypothetical protein